MFLYWSVNAQEYMVADSDLLIHGSGSDSSEERETLYVSSQFCKLDGRNQLIPIYHLKGL